MFWLSSALLALLCQVVAAVQVPRSTFIRGAAAGLIASRLPPAFAAESESESLAKLRVARQQLEPCASMISAGSWDGVRTVIKSAPLASSKALVSSLIRDYSSLGTDADDLVVPREDLVQALQLLDMAVEIYAACVSAPNPQPRAACCGAR